MRGSYLPPLACWRDALSPAPPAALSVRALFFLLRGAAPALDPPPLSAAPALYQLPLSTLRLAPSSGRQGGPLGTEMSQWCCGRHTASTHLRWLVLAASACEPCAKWLDALRRQRTDFGALQRGGRYPHQVNLFKGPCPCSYQDYHDVYERGRPPAILDAFISRAQRATADSAHGLFRKLLHIKIWVPWPFKDREMVFNAMGCDVIEGHSSILVVVRSYDAIRIFMEKCTCRRSPATKVRIDISLARSIRAWWRKK